MCVRSTSRSATAALKAAKIQSSSKAIGRKMGLQMAATVLCSSVCVQFLFVFPVFCFSNTISFTRDELMNIRQNATDRRYRSTLQISEHQNDQTQEQFLPPSNPSHENLTLNVEHTTLLYIIYSLHILIFFISNLHISDLYTHNCLYYILCFCYFVHCQFVYYYFIICVLSCCCHSVALWSFFYLFFLFLFFNFFYLIGTMHVNEHL